MKSVLNRTEEISDAVVKQNIPTIENLGKIFKGLEEERRKWETRWREIQESQLPYVGNLYTNGKDNPAERKDTAVVNGIAQQCATILAAGIMSGLTPTSRKWFKIQLRNRQLEENSVARAVLDSREEMIENLLQASNFYNIDFRAYQELPFGQFVVGSFRDKEKGLYFTQYTIGTYYLDSNSKGEITTFGQKEGHKAKHVQEMFGYDALPDTIRAAIDNKNYNNEFIVYWLVYPNEDYDERSQSSKRLKYRSVYWTKGCDKPLYVGGFHEFPFHVGRYNITGLQPYGKGPAWMAEGDNKYLQKMHVEIVNGVELQNNPPLAVDANTYARGVNVMPAGLNVISQESILKPLYEKGLRVDLVGTLAKEAEERIRKYYSADLFMMLDQLQEGKMTATEVTARTQEKLQQLGPVVQNIQNEFLDGIIERIYNTLDRAGKFPEIPPELQEELDGEDLAIEYIAPLAQAQRMSGLVNIEQALSFLAQVAQLDPTVIDIVDMKATVKEYYKNLSVPAVMSRTDEQVQAIIEQREQAMRDEQERAQMAEMADKAAPIAQAAKNLSEAAGQNPALAQLMGGGMDE